MKYKINIYRHYDFLKLRKLYKGVQNSIYQSIIEIFQANIKESFMHNSLFGCITIILMVI